MQLFSEDLMRLAQDAVRELEAAGKRVATAESCTGGLIAGLLTEVPGSSGVLGRSFVVYSNPAKQEMLGVPADTLAQHGAVSAHTVKAMAEGALGAAGTDADIVVAVSGVAGPTGGSPDKPVGTVYLAVAARGGDTTAERHRFPGDRTEVRLRTAEAALEMLRARLR